MATTITKQVLENGNRNYVAAFKIACDGSAASEAPALDPTSSGDMGVEIEGQELFPGTSLKIWELKYTLPEGMNVRLLWEATSPQAAWNLSDFGEQSFQAQGGLFVPQSGGAPITGATGKVDLDVIAYSLPDGQAESYGTVEILAKKDVSLATRPPPPPSGGDMITESSDNMVTESGDQMVTES